MATVFFEINFDDVHFQLPTELFCYIFKFIPVYPYYFSLLRVNSIWNQLLKQQVAPQVTFLDVLDRLSFEEKKIWKGFHHVSGILSPGIDFFFIYRTSCEIKFKTVWQTIISTFPNITELILFIPLSSCIPILQSMIVQWKKLQKITIYGVNLQLLSESFFSLSVIDEFKTQGKTVQLIDKHFPSILKQISPTIQYQVVSDKEFLYHMVDQQRVPPSTFEIFTTQHLDGFSFAMFMNLKNSFTRWITKGYIPSTAAFVYALQHGSRVYFLKQIMEHCSIAIETYIRNLQTNNDTVFSILGESNSSPQIFEYMIQNGFAYNLEGTYNPLCAALTCNNERLLDFLFAFENGYFTMQGQYIGNGFRFNPYEDITLSQQCSATTLELCFSKLFLPSGQWLCNVFQQNYFQFLFSSLLFVFLKDEYVHLLFLRNDNKIIVLEALLCDSHNAKSFTEYCESVVLIATKIGWEKFLSIRGTKGKTPLHWIVNTMLFYYRQETEEAMETALNTLVSYFPKEKWIESMDENGNIPIFEATQYKVFWIVYQATTIDISFTWNIKNFHQQTLFHVIALQQQSHSKITVEWLQLAYEQGFLFLDAIDNQCNTIFHILFCSSAVDEIRTIFLWLLTKPELQNLLFFKNERQETPLFQLFQSIFPLQWIEVLESLEKYCSHWHSLPIFYSNSFLCCLPYLIVHKNQYFRSLNLVTLFHFFPNKYITNQLGYDCLFLSLMHMDSNLIESLQLHLIFPLTKFILYYIQLNKLQDLHLLFLRNDATIENLDYCIEQLIAYRRWSWFARLFSLTQFTNRQGKTNQMKRDLLLFQLANDSFSSISLLWLQQQEKSNLLPFLCELTSIPEEEKSEPKQVMPTDGFVTPVTVTASQHPSQQKSSCFVMAWKQWNHLFLDWFVDSFSVSQPLQQHQLVEFIKELITKMTEESTKAAKKRWSKLLEKIARQMNLSILNEQFVLHDACEKQCMEAVIVLLKIGMDSTLKNFSGQLPVQLLHSTQQQRVFETKCKKRKTSTTTTATRKKKKV